MTVVAATAVAAAGAATTAAEEATAAEPATAPVPAAPLPPRIAMPPDTPPAAAARARGAAPAGDRVQDAALQAQRRDDRQDQRHRGTLAADLGPEGLARGAGLDVAPQRRAPQGAAAQRRELLLDVAAGRVARLARLHEGGTRLEDEGGDPGAPDAEDVRDLLVVEVAQLGEDERGALVVAQRVQIVDERLQIGPLLDLGSQTYRDG